MQLLEILRPWHVAPPAAQRVLDNLVRAYSAPERHYHNVAHVEAVLALLEKHRAEARSEHALALAAWFHDAVYDPRASDNEERSADLAEAWLGPLGVPPEVLNEIRRLILLTKSHRPAEEDTDGKLLVDADLAILGSAPHEYRRYAAAIRREYTWVPEEAYRAGRSQVLARFLERPRIYHTESFFRDLEQAARANLGMEMQQLGA